MEDLTRTVLEDLARWKRMGVLPTRCTLCGCGEDDHHAETCPSYVAPPGLMTATLRVLTTDEPAPLPDPCQGTYSCGCQGCEADRARLLKHGSRDVRQPWEAKRAA